MLAIAIADDLELFDVSDGTVPGPLPDVVEHDGVVYSSRPVAVRADGDGFELERRRETVTADGRLTTEQDLIHLDRVDPDIAGGRGARPPGCARPAGWRSRPPRSTSAARW